MSATVAKSTDLSPAARLMLNGAELDPKLLAQVVDVRVETTNGLPDVCTIRIAELGPDEDAAERPIIDHAALKIGASVSVKLAKAVGGGLENVFDGEVTTIESDFATDPGTARPAEMLVLVAHDRSHRLHRRFTPRTLRQMSATDVVRKVAGEHGLAIGTLNFPAGQSPLEVIHQVGESDWAFASRIARDFGGELDVDGNKLHVLDPAAAARPVATVVWGQDLQRFHGRVSVVGQVDEVTVNGWDPKQKQLIEQKATPKAASKADASALASAVSGTKAVVVGAPASTGHAKARAASIAQRVGHERVQAEAVTRGTPALRAGRTVTIEGVGKRFSGDHRIVSATHVYGRLGYETRLTLGAGGGPLAQSMRAGASQSFSASLVIGIVTDNNDPDKLGRIKVRYPTLGQNVESDWVRVAREAAGKARGTVALPHVNDEVVLGFEHGDVQRPFVLGVLFNGKDAPEADLVKTTSSVAARYPRDLDVATKQKALLAAPKGVSATAEQGPVEVTAGGAMTLKAGQQSPAALTIETNGQLKATGKQGAELVSQGPLKITAAAPITIESKAVLQIKGSVIQIQGTGIVQISGGQVILG